MDTALNEITLVLFTTVAPAGVVGFMVMALDAMLTPDKARADAVSRYLVVPLVLVISGLIASATHLGTPANALYVLMGVGRSPLSNEVVSAVVFLALAGVYWMVSFRGDVPRRLRMVWLAVVALAGVALVTFISLAYSVDSVPTWSLPTVPIALWLGALSSGSLVGLAGLMLARREPSRRMAFWLLLVSLVATVLNTAVLFVEWDLLKGIATTVISAVELVPAFPWVDMAYALGNIAGIALAAAVFVRGGMISAFRAGGQEGVSFARVRTRRVVAVCVAAVLGLAACFAVRFAFYAMHMTLGV